MANAKRVSNCRRMASKTIMILLASIHRWDLLRVALYQAKWNLVNLTLCVPHTLQDVRGHNHSPLPVFSCFLVFERSQPPTGLFDTTFSIGLPRIISLIIHCYPLLLLPSVCPVGVRFSKPTLLIIHPQIFSFLLITVNSTYCQVHAFNGVLGLGDEISRFFPLSKTHTRHYNICDRVT